MGIVLAGRWYPSGRRESDACQGTSTVRRTARGRKRSVSTCAHRLDSSTGSGWTSSPSRTSMATCWSAWRRRWKR